jgi:sulfite reductase (NADPH) flavoprotein alpha-component
MASGVDQVLKEILGHEQVEQLKQQQRYQRDVY